MSPASPLFFVGFKLWAVFGVWRRQLCQLKNQKSSVLNVVVSEFGKMACDILLWERCSGMFAETVPIGFPARNSLRLAIFPLFLF